jgi:hypothetical protein
MISWFQIILNHPNSQDWSVILMSAVREMRPIPEEILRTSVSGEVRKAGVSARRWHVRNSENSLGKK